MEWRLSKRFFRPDEVARLLALSRRTIYRMIRDGRLQAIKWGSGPWRIPREALLALLPADNWEI
ncbi:MAG: helix-turn-helix domain-containing protein [Thermodesulfobacteriota bacterium]|nr:helix-turn-helix domain-containing protein [Syntrophales bacterium]MDD5641553.1 helix-turn-helix domain-containing protein [Syntrophales bacterium]